VVEAFRDHGIAPGFRLADIPELDAIREAVAAHGLTGRQPTVMKIGDVSRLAEASAGPARLLPQPDAAWTDVFIGDGFEPEESARRMQNLSRSPGALYGAAGEGGVTEAVGVATLCHGVAGVHGMRTAPAHRGKGHAAAILGAFGRALAAQGVGKVVLQVEEPNPARRIYRRAGFEPLWMYRYWR
jgi:GNAT superfamily N-acetyltransferase